MADLKPAEVEKAKLHFDIFDRDGSGKCDLVDLGGILRSLDLRPTEAAVQKAGGTKKRGEKTISLEEFLPIFSQAKKDKDCGAYEDLAEGMKVYDKNENGTMMAAELAHTLMALGERLEDAEVDEIMKLAGTEDEDGYIRYDDFLKKVLAGPFPEQAAA
ncbi:Myosin light chain alkali [Halotydeus destructor]|nr:Myosin light chain alkali [Halotydeus destructor]